VLNTTLARRRRKELGLTMTQVAELCEVSVAAISRLEGGQRDPSIGLLRRYARALQVDPGELVTEPEPEEVAAS
jgi:transcriptional regulator with XRE-family HTH domain